MTCFPHAHFFSPVRWVTKTLHNLQSIVAHKLNLNLDTRGRRVTDRCGAVDLHRLAGGGQSSGDTLHRQLHLLGLHLSGLGLPDVGQELTSVEKSGKPRPRSRRVEAAQV